MTSRTQRLKKLVEVQQQMKAFHEARRAGYLSAAAAARDEAADLARRADGQSEIAAAFPDLYNRRIDAALARGATNDGLAAQEARQVATATLRTNRVEKAHRDSAAADERQQSDKDRLEMITARLTIKR